MKPYLVERLRKAKEALEESSKGTPVPVFDTFPFTGDDGETQPLLESELQALASTFHLEDPEIPSEGLVPCLYILLPFVPSIY